MKQARKKKTNTIYHLYVESKIWYRWTYLWNTNRFTDKECRFMITKGERRWGRNKLGFGVNIYKLLNMIGLPRWPSWKSMCLSMQELQKMRVWSLDPEDPLKEEMATFSNILAWNSVLESVDKGAWRSTVDGCKELHTAEHAYLLYK